MDQQTKNFLMIIKTMGDRCVQRGNIFNNIQETYDFINAFNNIAAKLEMDKANQNGETKQEDKKLTY